MHFKIYKPHPSIASVVDYYWHTYAALNESIIQEVPTPLLQGMSINLSGRKEQMQFTDENQLMTMKSPVYIFGQSLGPRKSISNEQGIDVLGIKFTTLGFHALTGMNIRHITDKIIDAEDIWGKEVAYLSETLYDINDVPKSIKILDEYFFKKLCKVRKTNVQPFVAEALKRINHSSGMIRIKQLPAELFTSQSTLERAFLNQIGMTPKLYARILRYNKVKSLIDNGQTNWQEICFNFGYFDQSHFIKEFSHFSGLSPEVYIRKNKLITNIF